MKLKLLPTLISLYKILGSIFRIFLGLIILYSNGRIDRILGFFFRKEVLEDPKDFFANYLYTHLTQVSYSLALILAVSLILFSVLEIFFSVQLIYRKKSGAIGLFAVSLVWSVVEIFFISEFIAAKRLVVWIIDIIILALLIWILTHSRKYLVNSR